MVEWQLAEAKNKFSEIVSLALTKKPQKIRRRNQAVIVISEDEYHQLKRKSFTFVDYLIKGPSFEGLDLVRDTSEVREFIL